MTLVREQTPEEEELAKKLKELAELEDALAERELELATLQNELNSFESRYLSTVGRRFAELDELKAKIAEARAAASPDDAKARDESADARETASDSAGAVGDTPDLSPDHPFEPSEGLKWLFRQVAKLVHPDLADDEQDRTRRTRLMADANRAFEQGDEAKLRAISEEWSSSPEAVKGEGAGAELVRAIRKIAQVHARLGGIEVAVDQVRELDMFELMRKADEADTEGRDLLTEMAEALEKQISDAKAEGAAAAG